jgi:hypothetical protein
VVLLAACKKEAPPPAPSDVPAAAPAANAEPPPAPDLEGDPELKWFAVSSNSKAVVTHVGQSTGRCKVNCMVGETEHWTSANCLGRKLDLRFVSNDCEKLVVMHQLPEVDKNWAATALIHIYRKGAPEYVVAVGGIWKTPKALKATGSSFYWMAGALEQPGEPPRYSADGNTVEFDTLDGRRQTVSLLASAKPQKVAAKKSSKSKSKKRR